MNFESFYKGEKEKIYFLKNVGLMIIFFHFLKHVHVLNTTKNIVVTNKLIRINGLTNIAQT